MAYQVHFGYRTETGQKMTKECQEILDHRVLLAQLVQMVPRYPRSKGESGSSGMLATRNRRECAWKNSDDNRDYDLIKVRFIIVSAFKSHFVLAL